MEDRDNFSLIVMKVLVVNPWVGNIANYTHGFCEGLSNHCDVTLVTNYYDVNNSSNYKIIKSFFRISDKIDRGPIRKGIRGIEYMNTFNKILKIVRKERFDVIHIQWFLMYKIDIRYIEKVRKYSKVVLTAHNVLPHVNGEQYIKQLKEIYDRVDRIFVHGESIRDEFSKYFKDDLYKVRIQHHGDMMLNNTDYNTSEIPDDLKDRISSAEKKYIFFGNIFYNKGTDLLLQCWIDAFRNNGNLLIIAGRTTEPYPVFESLIDKARDINNIIIMNEYIEDNLLNYMVSNSDVIVLPYRHATMSGVVFTAAQFKKPIICTEAGSILEYVSEGQNCFLCKPELDDLKKTITTIDSDYTKEQLSDMGMNLYEHILSNYSWKEIGRQLCNDYQELLVDE